MERLQKVIASRGYCSRRKAEELIIQGKVKVNGIVIDRLGFKVNENDEIIVEGNKLDNERKIYYLLNKPKNVISSVSDDKGRVCVVDLIDSPYRIYPFGRLDYDSSGLLILSNDGELMQKIIHPTNEIEKVYEVKIDKILTIEEIKRIEKGIRIDNYISAPCKIRIIRKNKSSSNLEITIHEGKNREIRKMMKSVGANVLKLHRIKEANISLGNLKSGEYRELKPFEIKELKNYLNRNNI